MKKIIDFIKYNNAFVLMIAFALILGGSVFAAPPDAFGQRTKFIQGVDNKLLLETDLDKMNMDFKINNIAEDEKYYYVEYSFLDLNIIDGAWQYDLKNKTRKVTKKIDVDLSKYLAEEFSEERSSRLRDLKEKQEKAKINGEEKRVEITSYNGLIGKTLDIADKIFPGYEAVEKVELSSPIIPKEIENIVSSGTADDLTKIYNDYILSHPEIQNFSNNLNTNQVPAISQVATATPDSEVSASLENSEGGIASPTPIIENVEIIELSASSTN